MEESRKLCSETISVPDTAKLSKILAGTKGAELHFLKREDGSFTKTPPLERLELLMESNFPDFSPATDVGVETRSGGGRRDWGLAAIVVILSLARVLGPLVSLLRGCVAVNHAPAECRKVTVIFTNSLYGDQGF